MKSQSMNTKTLVLAGLMTAIITVMTAFLKIPIAPPGYIHLGNVALFIGAYILGWPWGILVAAVSGLLADLIAGAGLYIIGSIIVQSLCALWIVMRAKKMTGGKKILDYTQLIVGAALIILAGYFLYDLILGGFSLALSDLGFNLVQVAVNGALAMLLLPSVDTYILSRR